MTGVVPPLGDQEVHVWIVALAPGPPGVAALRVLLSDDERKRLDGFRHEGASRDYLLSRAALRLLIAGYCDTTLADVTLHYGDHGKPALDPAAGLAPLQFNLSHAGDYAAIACTRHARVGVDIESMTHRGDLAAVARRFFRADEQALVIKGDAVDPARFCAVWTTKEAALKVSGAGLADGLDSVQVHFDDAGCPELVSDNFQLFALDAPEGYCLAVALDPPAVAGFRLAEHPPRLLQFEWDAFFRQAQG
jgi:4'-phosphopantetheinyl transferase